MIMNEVMYARFEGVKVELRRLFPQGEIELVQGQNPYDDSQPYDDYILVVGGESGVRLGYLKMRFYGGDELLELQLYRDDQYQVNQNIRGISWFKSEDGRYKKPTNYQLLELFINHVWAILN